MNNIGFDLLLLVLLILQLPLLLLFLHNYARIYSLLLLCLNTQLPSTSLSFHWEREAPTTFPYLQYLHYHTIPHPIQRQTNSWSKTPLLYQCNTVHQYFIKANNSKHITILVQFLLLQLSKEGAMALFLSLFLIFMFPSSNAQGGPPSPGYYPSSRYASQGFNQDFRTLWGPQNQRVDQGSLTIWLDTKSGQVMSHLLASD